MKLARTNTSPLGEPGFEYHQQLWGDMIYGTREQLQSIGIAVGMAFPGESGGPKRQMTVTDPRGFPTTISDSYEGIFSASIPFPGRDRKKRWIDYAAGVRKCTEIGWCDEYIGTVVALAAAGLVRLDQMPGQPGMRKMRVTILPDGTPQEGATSNHSTARDSGAKVIERASKAEYLVRVGIPDDEKQRRSERVQGAKRQWEARMLALPRPAPLIELPDAIGTTVKVKPVPQYRADGNVLYLLPKSAP